MVWYDKLEIPLGIVGLVGVIWYGIAMGYTYINTGTKGAAMDDNLSHQVALIIAVAILGTFILAIGLIIITYRWVDIWSKSLIGILLAFIAMGLSVSAMSIAALTH
jgi:hypothetical protein